MGKEIYIVVCRKHWTVFLWRGIVAFIFLILGISDLSAETSISIPCFVIVIICFVTAFISYKTDYIGMTDSKIVGHKGFIRSKKISSPLSKVQNIEISNGLFGKIFKYHTIVIDNAGTGGKEFKFTQAANAEAFVNAVHERIA